MEPWLSAINIPLCGSAASLGWTLAVDIEAELVLAAPSPDKQPHFTRAKDLGFKMETTNWPSVVEHRTIHGLTF